MFQAPLPQNIYSDPNSQAELVKWTEENGLEEGIARNASKSLLKNCGMDMRVI